jgi:uncharacterized protein
MDRAPDPLVARFVRELLPKLRARFQPTQVIVFGSRARGEALLESDLDLLIVSERFRDIRFLDRSVAVLQELDPPFGMDVLCYTPEEFGRKRDELGIVSEAVETGLVL